MFPSSLVSVDSVTYLSTPFTILSQDAVLSWTEIWPELLKCNGLDEDRRIHPLARVFFLLRGIVYSRHKCCICGPSSVSGVKKYLSYSCTRFLRCCASVEFSAIERSIGISIFSKCLGAASFLGALGSLGTWLHKSFPCSEDTELIRRIHLAEKQLDVFMTTIECIDFLPPSLLLSEKHWRHETLDDQVLRNLPSYSLQIDSMFRRVCQCKFRTSSLLIQAPRKTNDREVIYELNSQLSVQCIHNFLCFLLFSIQCRCTSTGVSSFELLRFTL